MTLREVNKCGNKAVNDEREDVVTDSEKTRGKKTQTSLFSLGQCICINTYLCV